MVLDVYTGSVPFENVARFIRQRIGANKEPAIRSVETANPSFRVNRGARSQTRLPLLDKFLAIIGMDRFRPPPALRFFGNHARIIEPYLIDEVAIAIRTSCPCCRGDRIDDGGKIALGRLPRLLRFL